MIGDHLTFDGRADTVGNHRHPVGRAGPHDRRDFLGGVRKADGVRRGRMVPGLVMPVLIANSRRRGDPIAQYRLEIGDQRPERFRIGTRGKFGRLRSGVRHERHLGWTRNDRQ
ncbi:hypothetical protein BC443_08105 [Salinicola sp. MIT1003]|nr:hypothetical protein BC443_08105 [Salinicola sp. MIT1003]